MWLLLNLALYQGVWLLSVLWADLGGVFSLPLLLLHCLLSPYLGRDILLMLVLLVLGCLLDGSLQALQFITFTEAGRPIPFWLAMIWLALATLPNHALAWLQGRPGLSAGFGALGGPLAYWAGVELGAATFSQPLIPSLALLALVWAILWPLVMGLSRSLAGCGWFGSGGKGASEGVSRDKTGRRG
ncbi:DUF2878 domain-containing protein [Desulfogranum mediterraneum]|uniref:DUF2878 domain-containing protein n=1 Tax=Desulfogranum mediterraneum TaxID=160661 RepID=UPI0003F8EDAD|nr:DUF2878 domain-containing protein [Desulfogranum mediterraneum]